MNKSFREKINKETRALNDTLHKMGLTDIYRAFHPKVVGKKVHTEHFPGLTICWATR